MMIVPRLQEIEFEKPRNGKKSDHAHPPIHPTAYAGHLTGDEKRVYEFVTRHFLACCSKDALGFQTTMEVAFGGEIFVATGKERTAPEMLLLIHNSESRSHRVGAELPGRVYV